jgi:hypothetical protein
MEKKTRMNQMITADVILYHVCEECTNNIKTVSNAKKHSTVMQKKKHKIVKLNIFGILTPL